MLSCRMLLCIRKDVSGAGQSSRGSGVRSGPTLPLPLLRPRALSDSLAHVEVAVFDLGGEFAHQTFHHTAPAHAGAMGGGLSHPLHIPTGLVPGGLEGLMAEQARKNTGAFPNLDLESKGVGSIWSWFAIVDPPQAGTMNGPEECPVRGLREFVPGTRERVERISELGERPPEGLDDGEGGGNEGTGAIDELQPLLSENVNRPVPKTLGDGEERQREHEGLAHPSDQKGMVDPMIENHPLSPGGPP